MCFYLESYHYFIYFFLFISKKVFTFAIILEFNC